MYYLKQQMQEDTSLERRMQEQEEALQIWLRENKSVLNKKTTINIPVVVHIIYSADSQNIPDERVHAQIDALNASFSGQGLGSMGGFSEDLQADIEIQFCLARTGPDGRTTNGIERRETTEDGFQNNAVKFYNSGGLDAWDPTQYFNIWVCNYNYSDGTDYVFSAYAQFPGAGLNSTYGVVIRYGAFGLEDTSYYRGSGQILCHEVGHCFNLRHIWGDDGTSCNGSDFCDDTPNQAGRTEGKHSGVLTDACSVDSPGVMYMNYMDYSDDVIYANFTPDQKDRMRANFFAPNAPLAPLLASSVCGFPVGIETLDQPQFQLYPNPAKNKLYIKSTSNLDGAEYQIFDVMGNLVFSGEYRSSIDINSLSSGWYYIVIRQNHSRFKPNSFIVL